MKKPDIHMLSHNNVAYTLKSVKMLKIWSRGHRLHILDNGSEYWNLKKLLDYPWDDFDLRIAPEHIWSAETRSARVGGGKNEQIRWALENGSEWILQLDNDCHMKEGWWEIMEEFIKAFPQVGLWGLYQAPNHRTISPLTCENPLLVARIPSMISGTGVMFNAQEAVANGIRWPEEETDYSDHPYWEDMGGFTGVDVEFGERWRRAGFEFAMPSRDLLVHSWQPGRFDGYK